MFLTSLYLYEVMEKAALSLLETNNRQKIFKLSLSHCDKAKFCEWYKITVLGITFLFMNVSKIRDMLKIQWEICGIWKHKEEINCFNWP